MFLGEHEHSLDAKGRLILPAKYRDALQDAFVTGERDGCLALWPRDEFRSRAEEMRARSKGSPTDRRAARAFFSAAEEANPDRQGRIAIPVKLRSYAGLEREVVVCGQYDHVEIWDSARWRQHEARGAADLAGDEDEEGEG